MRVYYSGHDHGRTLAGIHESITGLSDWEYEQRYVHRVHSNPLMGVWVCGVNLVMVWAWQCLLRMHVSI